MDDIVKAALAKWPNVPHCYGWLALDARGNWRLRDERAQALNLPGDKLMHEGLIAFINRNYDHDEHGNWYFQNGPQRVYVNLETTPYVAHTSPGQGLRLHTGDALTNVEQVYMTVEGNLIFETCNLLAQLDDRDLAPMLKQLTCDDEPILDDALWAWLQTANAEKNIKIDMPTLPPTRLRLERMNLLALMGEMGFIQRPFPA